MNMKHDFDTKYPLHKQNVMFASALVWKAE